MGRVLSRSAPTPRWCPRESRSLGIVGDERNLSSGLPVPGGIKTRATWHVLDEPLPHGPPRRVVRKPIVRWHDNKAPSLADVLRTFLFRKAQNLRETSLGLGDRPDAAGTRVWGSHASLRSHKSSLSWTIILIEVEHRRGGTKSTVDRPCGRLSARNEDSGQGRRSSQRVATNTAIPHRGMPGYGPRIGPRWLEGAPNCEFAACSAVRQPSGIRIDESRRRAYRCG